MAGPWRPGVRCMVSALLFSAGMVQAQTDAPAGDPAAAMLGFIDAAIEQGRLAAAQDLLVRARAAQDGPEVALREMELLMAAGALDAAMAGYDRLAAEPSVAARAGVGKGVALLRLGRTEEAEAALAAGLQIDPALVRGWIARGALADRRGDWTAAEAHYARALALAPQSAAAWNNRGYSRLLQGRAAEAEADLRQAVALDSGLAAARTNLRLAQALQGRYAEAFAGSTKAELARDLNTVGFAAMARGDLALAESYFSRALELNGRYDSTAAANLAYLRELAADGTKSQPPALPARSAERVEPR